MIEEVCGSPDLDLRASLASGVDVRGPEVVPVDAGLVQREDARTTITGGAESSAAFSHRFMVFHYRSEFVFGDRHAGGARQIHGFLQRLLGLVQKVYFFEIAFDRISAAALVHFEGY